MINIYSTSEAEESILVRKPMLQNDYSPEVLARTVEIFGPGTNPSTAVDVIIKTVSEAGDAAVLGWSRKLDHWDGPDLLVPEIELEQAWRGLSSELQAALQLAADRIRGLVPSSD